MDAVYGQGRVAAPDPTEAAAGEVEVLLVAFRGWLICERGLATESVRCYGSQARTFLAQLPAPLEESLAGWKPRRSSRSCWVRPPRPTASGRRRRK